MDTLTALALRLRSQLLADNALDDPREVVAWFGAMQAQDFAAVKWAVGLRTAGASGHDVEAAMDEGALVRTHALRPTWHVMAAGDARWILGLTGPRVLATTRGRQLQLGLGDALVARSSAALADATRGGRAITRAEARHVLRGAGVPVDEEEQRLPWLVSIAELQRVLCNGPMRGKAQTWANFDERVPAGEERRRDDALTELAKRYFRAHGPAVLRDFTWWSGLAAGDCRRAIALAGDALEADDIDGTPCWLTRGARDATRDPGRLRLLPAFDEYTVGYADRTGLFAGEEEGRGRTIGGLMAWSIVDGAGRVIGSWRRVASRRGVSLEAGFFGEADDEVAAAFAREGDRYRRFLGEEDSEPVNPSRGQA